MTWVGKSLHFLFYGAIAAISAWTAYQVTQEKFRWEINALIAKDEEHDDELAVVRQDQRDMERAIMDKLTLMHGDIRKIEGKLER